ncbi:C40 family peptidase [Bacillus rubiinfantis]|uniref:C40 family peptidase n=1 Tax=Bacillus rubiinfantis TaxID=1499680 RepID=UPI0006950BC2|nr:C40 family peptidase [Bacillus rubiinfantis]
MIKKVMKYTVSVAVLTSMFQVTPAFATPVTQGQIDATQGQIEDFETKIQMLDDRIIVAMDKSEKLNASIKTQQEKVGKTKLEIEEAKKALEAHKEVYSERLKSIQLEGKQSIATYAELLLSSENISEFLTRFTAISQILQSDTDLLNGLNEKEQALKDAEEKLHKELDQLKDSQEELAVEQKQIEADKKEIAKELAAAKTKLKGQKAQLARQKAEEEEERQAQLAEQQAQQESQTATQSESQQQDQQSSPKADKPEKSKPSAPALPADASKASRVIAYAKQFRGVPYRWGGTTPSGFDCSGFTQYVFRSVGVSLPRVSRAQQNYGTKIPLSQVQPGDLIFRGNPAHHVGIYIGGGQYIHAPQTGDVVKIAPFNPAKFTTAARVLR